MPSVHLHGLTYAHTSAATILEAVDVDLDVDRGDPTGPAWVGVVGANGAGKTTLLRLVAGELMPIDGRIEVHSAVPPRLVPQPVDGLSDDVRAFARTWDGTAQKLRHRLQLDPDDLDEGIGGGWPTLSPGQRKRWQLAAALADDPDVLLLDEPTNHLDAGARDLVLGVLAGFRGLGLVVSHDRTVLEQLTSRTLRLHRQHLVLHAGAYGEASERWRATEVAARERHDRARGEVRRQQRIRAEVRRDRHSAEVAPRRERRLAGASQPDAREAGRKFAQRKAEAALARRVAQMNTRVGRAEAELDTFGLERDVGDDVAFRHSATRRRLLVEVVGDVAHDGGQVWLHGVDVSLFHGEAVHLTGVNGAGKSTLLDAVARALAAHGEVLARMPQELTDPEAELHRVVELDSAQRGRVLGALATLGVDPDQLLATDAPSPGEARKLLLARLLVGDASVLVLDEPTNHLDIPSIERLQAALAAWPGALLLVTHDDALAAATTTTTWEVAAHRVRVDRRGPEEGGRRNDRP